MRLLVLMAVMLAPAIAAPSEPVPTVRTAQGIVSGLPFSEGGAVFLGIPYASPPVGRLRWRPPIPPKPWRSVRRAAHYGSACTQPPMGWNDAVAKGSGEDCLYLNVWTPRLGASASLPVMVWIHGGGFVGGGATDALFNGAALARKGVVVVTINYRLGVFGFLAHPQLSSESPHHSSGNYGLLDQLAALQWVRDNIAAFGGNPQAVTLFGQSAGGASVLFLMSSDRARGLLRGAIVESGSMLDHLPSLSHAETVGVHFAGTASLEQLRALSTAELQRRWMIFTTAGGADGRDLGPVVDGWLIAEDPVTLFAAHREPAVPLLIGNNAREALVRISETNLRQAIGRFYGPEAPTALRLYHVDGDPGVEPDGVLGTFANQFATDISMRCGAVITAMRHAATGAPVYEYQFEQPLPGRLEQGAQHSYELPFVFGNLQSTGPFGGAFTPKDHALSRLMIAYWTNFARFSDPNGSQLPRWPRWRQSNPAYVRFSESLPGDVVVGQGLRRDYCRLLEAKVRR